MIQSATDAKSGCRYTYAGPKGNLCRCSDCQSSREELKVKVRTYVTPDGCEVFNATTPYNGIDKLHQAQSASPNHESTSSSVPCLHMPWQRYNTQEETEKSENGEERISGVKRVHGEQDVEDGCLNQNSRGTTSLYEGTFW